MNVDTIAGEGITAKGRIKESIGTATADPVLQNEGIADQLSGNLRRAFGAARDFARAQPLLTAVIVASNWIGGVCTIKEANCLAAGTFGSA